MHTVGWPAPTSFSVANEEGLKYAADALLHHPRYLTGLRITIACNVRLLCFLHLSASLRYELELLGGTKTLRTYRKPIV